MDILLGLIAILVFIIAASIGLFYERILKSGLFKLENKRDYIIFILSIAIPSLAIIVFGVSKIWPAIPTGVPTATLTEKPILTPSSPAITEPSSNEFAIYRDASSAANHFTPSGYLGDTGDISIDEAWSDKPHAGSSSIQITYTPGRNGPSACSYTPPCKWAGIYWQSSPNNWGETQNTGFNLSGYTKLTFWARSDTEVHITFSVGGITGKYPDSLQPARSTGVIPLSHEWQQYVIDLSGGDLSYVICGFSWNMTWYDNGIEPNNSKVFVFYLDDILFQK
jgi:hypothetical protein